ncbi:Wiskott-Aldrich syndrome protein member 1 [Balamuthia mandrillaris]
MASSSSDAAASTSKTPFRAPPPPYSANSLRHVGPRQDYSSIDDLVDALSSCGNAQQKQLRACHTHAATGLLGQMSDLLRHASDLFSNLTQSLSQTESRMRLLSDRITAAEEFVPALSDYVATAPGQVFINNASFSFASTRDESAQLFTQVSRSETLKAVHSKTEPPPDVDQLREYMPDGQSCLKLYTNPDFFIEEWLKEQELQAREARKRREKRDKRKKKAASKGLPKTTQEVNVQKLKVTRWNQWGEKIEEGEEEAGNGPAAPRSRGPSGGATSLPSSPVVAQSSNASNPWARPVSHYSRPATKQVPTVQTTSTSMDSIGAGRKMVTSTYIPSSAPSTAAVSPPVAPTAPSSGVGTSSGGVGTRRVVQSMYSIPAPPSQTNATLAAAAGAPISALPPPPSDASYIQRPGDAALPQHAPGELPSPRSPKGASAPSPAAVPAAPASAPASTESLSASKKKSTKTKRKNSSSKDVEKKKKKSTKSSGKKSTSPSKTKKKSSKLSSSTAAIDSSSPSPTPSPPFTPTPADAPAPPSSVPAPAPPASAPPAPAATPAPPATPPPAPAAPPPPEPKKFSIPSPPPAAPPAPSAPSAPPPPSAPAAPPPPSAAAPPPPPPAGGGSAPVQMVAPQIEDKRSGLLQQIQTGLKLKKTEQLKREQKPSLDSGGGINIAAILARRVAMEFSDSEDDDDSDDDSDWEE